MPRDSRGLHVDGRRAIIPLSLTLLAVLWFAIEVPWWVLLPASLIVPVGYFVATLYVHRKWPAFESRFNQHLMAGDVDALWATYRDARWLRLLAPPYRAKSRLGLVLSLRGDFRRAEEVLESAWELAPKSRRGELLGPLARVKHELGEVEDLRALSEEWRVRSLFPGAANLYLAAAMLRDPRETDVARAVELLDEAESGLSAADRERAAGLREHAERRLAARAPNN